VVQKDLGAHETRAPEGNGDDGEQMPWRCTMEDSRGVVST
jgi:hypothetical protein